VIEERERERERKQQAHHNLSLGQHIGDKICREIPWISFAIASPSQSLEIEEIIMGSSMEQNQQATMTARRSLFPSSYSKKQARKNKNLTVTFSPYARQKLVESVKHMSEVEKTDVWYQKSDYEDFAKVSRIISKAMLEGGSEVWLMSKSPTADTHAPTVQAAAKNVIESSTLGEAPSRRDLRAVKTFNDTRSEWWTKFGHSRRGLEHIASVCEGKQRHRNVRESIQAVLDEQKMQKMFLPAGYFDTDKIRSVYVQQTHWARALARAMGEADADEVKCNFDAAKRKPREFFLKAHLSKDASDSENLPSFMQAVLAISSNKLDLDANTMSQIRFRNQPETSESFLHLRKHDSFAEFREDKETPILPVEDPPEEKHLVATPSSEESPSELSKKAAGFLGNNGEDQDQLRILTGMGITSTSPATLVG
jgi:hypothetical protein